MKNTILRRETEFVSERLKMTFKDIKKSLAGILLFVIYLAKFIFDLFIILIQPLAIILAFTLRFLRRTSPEFVAVLATIIFATIMFFILRGEDDVNTSERVRDYYEMPVIANNSPRNLDLDVLAMSLIYVESRGNDEAVSDSSTASGPLQELMIYVDEANRIQRLNNETQYFSYEDRFIREKAIEMFKIIQRHHNSEMSFQKACTIHRGYNSQHYTEAVGRVYDSIQAERGILDSYALYD